MDPRKFREFASELATKQGPTIAELRSAVSRGYYALYHVVVELLRKMGIKHAGGWIGHQMIPEALKFSHDHEVMGAAAPRENSTTCAKRAGQPIRT